jgi:retron-type reverse transcriptase
LRIIKSAKHILSKPLADIFNRSIETGIYPNKLKIAKIIPIYKTEDEIEPNNYRPISLLSVFNNIFEKTMYKSLDKYLNMKNILCPSQYGFRQQHSTQHAILDIVNKMQTNMDNKLYSCGIFIDLKKAFDTVDHDILLGKLSHYDIRGVVKDWFCSYLKHRSQTTLIGNCVSDRKTTLCGVPQGSVLGCLLFLIYINDISESSNIFNFFFLRMIPIYYMLIKT